MRVKSSFKRLSIVFVVLLMLALLPFTKLTAYAAGGSFSGHYLNDSGTVLASYNAFAKQLTISGTGDISFNRWVTMAQKINDNYYNTVSAWGYDISEDNMDIIFSGNYHAIKLCGSGGPKKNKGLFERFSGDIIFNDAVVISPTATSLTNMFAYASRFNEPVNWDTSNVTDMYSMFAYATSFNQPVEFDTSKVTDMSYMFYSAHMFNQPVEFDTSNVTGMRGMFSNATVFNQPIDFDTKNVTDMEYMFYKASNFSYPIFFDIRSVRKMKVAFAESEVEQIILRNLSSNSDVDAENAFHDCPNLRTLSFRGLKDASIEGFSANYLVREYSSSAVFKYANWGYNFTDNSLYRVYLDSDYNAYSDFELSADGNVKASWNRATKVLTISGAGEVKYDAWAEMAKMISYKHFSTKYGWDDSKPENDMLIRFVGDDKAIKLCGTEKPLNGLFRGYSGNVDFDGAVDISPTATNLSYMFCYATHFNEPVPFDTKNVMNMDAMFSNATSFNQEAKFNTSKVTTMQTMFYGAIAFNQDFSSSINSAESLAYMFFNSAVKKVSLFNVYTNKNVNGLHMFDGCSALEEVHFRGVKNVSIERMTEDYYVQEGNSPLVVKSASEGHNFTDNVVCSAYLQSSVPTVTLSAAGSGIKASWNAIPNANGYLVYRADTKGGEYSQIAIVTTLSYTDTEDLIAGMPYFYKVQARYGFYPPFNHGYYSESRGYYAPGALATPAKPSLTLDKNGNGIRLNWNSQDRIIGYQVFRSLSPDKQFTYLQTSSGNAIRYTNMAGLTQGRPFYYKMRAYRMAKGVRAYSPFSDIKGMFAGTDEQALGAVSFSLEDNPSVSAPNVRVRWTGVSGADGYCVYRWNSAAQNWTGLKKTGPNARVYTNINGVVNHKTNFYGMRTYHISGGTTYYGNIGQAKGFRVDK